MQMHNIRKTLCMTCLHGSLKTRDLPNILLHDVVLNWVTEYKYLGVFISVKMNDSCDMQRQAHLLYMEGDYATKKVQDVFCGC